MHTSGTIAQNANFDKYACIKSIIHYETYIVLYEK